MNGYSPGSCPHPKVWDAMLKGLWEIKETQRLSGGGNWSRDLYPARRIIEAFKAADAGHSLESAEQAVADINAAVEDHLSYAKDEPRKLRVADAKVAAALASLEEEPLKEGDVIHYDEGAKIHVKWAYFDFVQTMGGSSIPMALIRTAIRGGATIERAGGRGCLDTSMI